MSSEFPLYTIKLERLRFINSAVAYVGADIADLY